MSPMMTHRSLLIFGACVLIFLEGCTVIQFNTFSSPSLTEGQKPCGFGLKVDSVFGRQLSKSDDTINDNCIRLDWPGLNLVVRPNNIVTTRELIAPWPLPPFIPSGGNNPGDRPAPLWIELRLDPHDAEVAFDPMRVTLQTEDGRKLNSSGFIGPTSRTEFPGANAIQSRRRYPCSTGGDIQEKAGLIPVKELSCFWIRFNVSRSPVQSFNLSLDGLEKGGKPYQIQPIRFEKGSDWFFGTIP
jgi:hypothetical protein